MSGQLGRRALLGGAGGVALVGGCAPSKPKTPLAHLYGERWVHGAYEMYAQGYQKVEQQTEDGSFGAYRTLAQRGVTALDGLQKREVPFYVRVAPDERSFRVERKVPERLTFTAGMSDDDRAAATADWQKAREFIQTDYEEVQRLDRALSTLLSQQQRVRLTIDKSHEEQYRLVRQLRTLEAGPAPFALPYQVTDADYKQVLALLVQRLEDDAQSLGRIESSIVATGLVARATDANSGSLAANLRLILLAVDEDASAADKRAVTSPTGDERAKQIAQGQALVASLEATQEYKLWLRREQTRDFEAIGTLLSTLDGLTHLPISSVYKQVLDIWRSDGDYLDYLKVALTLAPGGSKLASALKQGVALTDKARSVQRSLAAGTAHDRALALLKQKGVGVLNTGTRYAEQRIERQLSFFSAPDELTSVTDRLASSGLFRGPVGP